MVATSRSSILSKLSQKWSATTLGNSLFRTSLSSTVALVFVSRFLLGSSQLTILKQIGATHCKLFVEFMTYAIHNFLLFCACTASRLYVFPCPFQLLVAHFFFSAFPSSNCSHLYFPYTMASTAPKNYALPCVRSLTVRLARGPTQHISSGAAFRLPRYGRPITFDCGYTECLDWLRKILR